MQKFRANGKLLIAGEYAVLDGALAFAIPTKLGQTLQVSNFEIKDARPKLFWKALLHDQILWFSVEFDLHNLEIIQTTNQKLALKLKEILHSIEQLKPGFFTTQNQNIECITQLEFPQNWGLGSSSTLISLLAQYTKVDAFELNQLTFKTSGYDIACASANQPIFYQIKNQKPLIEPLQFNPTFIDDLYFVFLNQKEDTQLSVSKHYKSQTNSTGWLNGVSSLSYNLAKTENLEEFEQILDLHEEMIASKIDLPKVKNKLFSDYEGSVKSLGAWGGDFVLITKREGFETYFQKKNYHIILKFKDLFN